MVSFIVPVYRCEASLERCVSSILAQTYTNLELILVDDGSPDNSGRLCDELAKQDPRIVVIHKENGGPSSARNRGLDAAKGQYVQFVDSDDYIDPDMTERLVCRMESQDVQLVLCGYLQVHPDHDEPQRFEEIDRVLVKDVAKIVPNFVYRTFPNALWNKLYQRAYMDHRFDERVRYGEDLLFNLQYLRKIQALSVCDFCPVHYVVDNPESLTGKVAPYKVDDMLLYYKECVSFYREYGCAENFRQLSKLCFNVVVYSTLRILSSPRFSESEKRSYVKNTLFDPAVDAIIKDCIDQTSVQRVIGAFIRLRNYPLLKLLAAAYERKNHENQEKSS